MKRYLVFIGEEIYDFDRPPLSFGKLVNAVDFVKRSGNRSDIQIVDSQSGTVWDQSDIAVIQFGTLSAK